MSNDKDFMRYARSRRFEYPDEEETVLSNSSISSGKIHSGGISEEHVENDDDTAGRGAGELAEPHGGNDIDEGGDPYAAIAEQAIAEGDIAAAFAALGQSITEMRNIESLKRVGELFYAAFVGTFQNTGYGGGDEDADKYVSGAIGMFLAYTVLGGDRGEVESYLEDMAGLFHDIGDFQAIYDSVSAKIGSWDLDEIITKFYNGGI